MAPAVEISGIARRFGPVQALAGIDLAVEQGEFFGLLGPNGAGKTTLISILAGLTHADRGKARVLGHDVVEDYRNARRLLGVVPQELVFDPFFTVRETLKIQSGYFGIRDNDAWIDEILHHLDLTARAEFNMRALSGGMKRRVLIGQALVHKPPVIVLDEPTAGVDVELRQSLWAFIRKLNADGHTIILTTHYLEEAEELADRVGIINSGRLLLVEDKVALLRRMGEKRVRITFAAPVGALPEGLDGKAELSEDRRSLVVTERNGRPRAGEILKRLYDAGLGVAEVDTRASRLEDVLIEILRGGGEA
jgi:ABC-2 type transport system ATP-binding protein